MSLCVLKRIVPFALCLLTGLAVWQLLETKLDVFQDVLYLEHDVDVEDSEIASSWQFNRAPLLIRPGQVNDDARAAWPPCENCVANVRVLLGKDGEVWTAHLLTPYPQSNHMTVAAIAAAHTIDFVPASENSKPTSVWIDAIYYCANSMPTRNIGDNGCAFAFDKNSARTNEGESWSIMVANE